MLSSCLNLAGCNFISYEAGKQSRQVLRRRFGVICPYLFFYDKRKKIQTCIVITIKFLRLTQVFQRLRQVSLLRLNSIWYSVTM